MSPARTRARCAMALGAALCACALEHPASALVDARFETAALPDRAEPTPDATSDVAFDEGPTDAAPDAAPPDVAPDAALDAPPDDLADAAADAPDDLPRDVTSDATPDLPRDMAPDLAIDLPRDVAPDLAIDLPRDVAPDLPVDLPRDVAPDLAPDVGCAAGLTRCGTACVNLDDDERHCGRCDSACEGGETCRTGACGCGTNQRLCQGVCVDVTTSNAHCGTCGNPCAAPETCQAGVCGCPNGRVACGASCVDVTADNNHCGRCGARCGAGACANGVCTCAGGAAWCAGLCVNLQNDANHCGACGNRCGTMMCRSGACVSTMPTCAPGSADCNANTSDGCEVDTNTSVTHCGACGRRCAAGQRCAMGTCAAARSCDEVHTLWPALPSGTQTLQPEGGSAAPVFCDMTTDGGGWTVIYTGSVFPTNLESTMLDYSVPSPQLRQASRTVLLAYRNGAQAVTDANWVTFPIPMQWVTQSPFRYERVDVMTMVSMGGAAASMRTLRFGWREFGEDCGSGWVTNALSGRICVVGTRAPFFNGWSSRYYMDRCPNSDRRWSDSYCTDSRRFTIAVR